MSDIVLAYQKNPRPRKRATLPDCYGVYSHKRLTPRQAPRLGRLAASVPTSCRNTRCSPAVRAPSASSSGRSASSSALVQQIRKCRDSKLSVRYNRCGKVSFRSSNWSICTLRMNPAQCGWLRQTVLYYWPPNAQDLQSSSFSVIWVFSPISIPKKL